MKRILLILVLPVMLLCACQTQPAELIPGSEYTYYADELEPEVLAEEPEPPPTPAQPQPEPENPTADTIPTPEEQIPFLEYSIPFVMPQANCDLEDELLDFMHSWWYEYLFPQFSAVSELSLESPGAIWGLFYRTRQKYSYGHHQPVPFEAINRVGHRFFGSDFSIPDVLTPTEIDGVQYHIYDGGRGGMPTIRYLLVSSLLDGDEIIATFLPYVPVFCWGDSTLSEVRFLYRHIHPIVGREVIWAPREAIYLEIPESHEVLRDYEGSVLYYVRIRVPQETLGTITVTFTREDGRLIAVSSVHNDNH